MLHPFYFFQIFSIIIWGIDGYYYYASAIFAISVASIVSSLQEMRAVRACVANEIENVAIADAYNRCDRAF